MPAPASAGVGGSVMYRDRPTNVAVGSLPNQHQYNATPSTLATYGSDAAAMPPSGDTTGTLTLPPLGAHQGYDAMESTGSWDDGGGGGMPTPAPGAPLENLYQSRQTGADAATCTPHRDKQKLEDKIETLESELQEMRSKRETDPRDLEQAPEDVVDLQLKSNCSVKSPSSRMRQYGRAGTNYCIRASTCPATHPMSGECLKFSSSNHLCKRLNIQVNKRWFAIGDSGYYTSVNDAFEKQKNLMERVKGMSRDGKLRSMELSSVIVKRLPSKIALTTVIVTKIVEFIVAVAVLLRAGTSGTALALFLLYFSSMTHYHVKEALKAKGLQKFENVLKANDVHDLQSIQMSDSKILIIHDGGKVTEFDAMLKPSKKCAGTSSTCIERQCCVRPH